jgi:hypothetical protein
MVPRSSAAQSPFCVPSFLAVHFLYLPSFQQLWIHFSFSDERIFDFLM